MKFTCQTLACTALLVLASHACAEGDARLVGRWNGGPDYFKVSCAFGPDGRYFLTTRPTGSKEQYESGRYVVKGGTLTFTTVSGETSNYEMALDGDTMQLKGPLQLTLKFEQGSKEVVLKEIAQIDALKRREDSDWARRFPLAKVQVGPHPAMDLPDDPNPRKVFEDAVVFGTRQTYIRYWNFSETWIVTDGPDPGNGKTQSQFIFFPNGRCFFRNIKYTGPMPAQGRPRPGKVDVYQVWARYRIDDLEKGPPMSEPLIIETDAGEVVKNRLIDGRRNLRWNDQHIAGNRIWDTFVLQRRNGDDPKMPEPSDRTDARPLPAEDGK